MKTFLWFTIIVSAFLIGFFALIGLASIGGPGPGAPLEGAAMLLLFGIMVLCGLVIAACLYFRPQLSARGVVVSAIVYAVILIGIHVLRKNSGEQVVRLHIRDPSGRFLSGAKVIYKFVPEGGGFGGMKRNVSGNLISDSSGLVIIASDRRCDIRSHISLSGYTNIEFDLDRQWGESTQQYFIRWLNPLVTPNPSGLVKSVDCRSYMGFVPSDKTIDLTIYLPIIGRDEPLPY
jgi:hypothetical protein